MNKIIQNGDQLEYELENVSTNPKDRCDWPLTSFDARDWAEHFCKLHPDKGDYELMLTWFACALMCGYDEAYARLINGRVKDVD